jgi:hypothetical protein
MASLHRDFQGGVYLGLFFEMRWAKRMAQRDGCYWKRRFQGMWAVSRVNDHRILYFLLRAIWSCNGILCLPPTRSSNLYCRSKHHWS